MGQRQKWGRRLLRAGYLDLHHRSKLLMLSGLSHLIHLSAAMLFPVPSAQQMGDEYAEDSHPRGRIDASSVYSLRRTTSHSVTFRRHLNRLLDFA